MIRVFAGSLFLCGIAQAIAGDPVRITRDRGDEFLPFWNPAGDTISFATNREPGRVKALGVVSVDGTGERLSATGLQDGFGIVGHARAVWAGSSGKLVTCEASNFHEYLEFLVGEGLLERKVLDGDEAAFKVALEVDGGGGSDSFDISRDGSTMAWRYSSLGGAGDVELRVAPYADLRGGVASERGRAVITREGEGSSDGSLREFGLGPRGEVFVLADRSGAGFDLFLYDLVGDGEAAPLTSSGRESGAQNRRPRLSPDGAWVAYESSGLIGSTKGGKLVMPKPDLWLLRIADRQAFALTETPDLSEVSPDWAPDGKRLVFARADTREAGTVEPGEPDNQNLYVLEIPETIFRTPLVDTDK